MPDGPVFPKYHQCRDPLGNPAYPRQGNPPVRPAVYAYDNKVIKNTLVLADGSMVKSHAIFEAEEPFASEYIKGRMAVSCAESLLPEEERVCRPGPRTHT